MAAGIDLPGAHLLLYSLEHDDVGVGRHRQGQHQAGDARQGERDRDQLDEREQQHRVDQQRRRGHQAEHAVEDEQEEDRERQARRAPASRPWSSACWPSVADTWVSEISFSSIGSAPMRRLSARSLVVVEVADVLDLRAGAAVDALGVLDEVDRRQRDDLVVERDREALEGLLAVGAPGGRMIFEPRSAIRLVTRAKASRPSSVNSIVTTGAFVFGSVLASGFLMSVAGQLRVVLEHEEALDLRRLVRRAARPRPPRRPWAP